jgi:4-carboxymuconolactone decarboxylase
LPRIPLPRPETMSEAQRKVYDEIVGGPRGIVRGPLLAALYSPELADRWQRFGELVRYHTSIPPRHAEMAILVTARASNCAFEWHAHEPWALRAGLEPELIAAIRKAESPDFVHPIDHAVYDFAFELQHTRTVTLATYRKVLKHYGPLGVVELAAVVGYYTMVAMTLNAHDISIPEDQSNPFAPSTP